MKQDISAEIRRLRHDVGGTGMRGRARARHARSRQTRQPYSDRGEPTRTDWLAGFGLLVTAALIVVLTYLVD